MATEPSAGVNFNHEQLSVTNVARLCQQTGIVERAIAATLTGRHIDISDPNEEDLKPAMLAGANYFVKRTLVPETYSELYNGITQEGTFDPDLAGAGRLLLQYPSLVTAYYVPHGSGDTGYIRGKTHNSSVKIAHQNSVYEWSWESRTDLPSVKVSAENASDIGQYIEDLSGPDLYTMASKLGLNYSELEQIRTLDGINTSVSHLLTGAITAGVISFAQANRIAQNDGTTKGVAWHEYDTEILWAASIAQKLHDAGCKVTIGKTSKGKLAINAAKNGKSSSIVFSPVEGADAMDWVRG